MDLISTTHTQNRDPQKTRDDWIVAAIDALLTDGIEGVRVLKLAKQLGVTRGSFYWHFDSHDDLLNAILAEWRARNTGVMIEALDQSQTLEEGILELFFVWVDHSQFDPLFDQAVRDWGRRSSDIGASIAKEDDNRISAIAAFYRRHGYEETDAFVRARVIYFTQLSYFALVGSEPIDQRANYIETYFDCFTGRKISPQVARDFAARLALEENKT